MTSYFLGVDGGGTRCRMRLADENLNTLAEDVLNTPANLQVRNGDAAYAAITELTGTVFAKAGLGPTEMANTTACFGMAGGRLERARADFEARNYPFAAVSVFDDIDIARAGAHEGGEGAVLIIGTGSAGMGIMDGQRYQIGGWGFLVGDTMSGGILGRELVRYTLLAHEGLVEASDLTRAVMQEFGNDGNEMMAWSFDNPDARAEMIELAEQGLGSAPTGMVGARPADYGRFVPMVFDFFEQGDPVAQKLMAFEHEAIDQYVNWFKQRGAKSIAIVGGLGQRLLGQLQARHGEIVTLPAREPMHGALLLAKQRSETD